ncbi:MAG: hypothetical protein Q9N68_08410 [Gammaproteobacteria bacterium]|nr:hypothetical protein [Gammaproteobacteria bacterium]
MLNDLGDVMKQSNFPYIGLLLGVSLLLMVMGGRELDINGEPRLPLLMLLLMNEFAFIISAISVFIGIKRMKSSGMDLLLAIVLGLSAVVGVVSIILGLQLWPL